jgi:hypothetical protein
MRSKLQDGTVSAKREYRTVVRVLHLLATIQLVWAYHSRVPPYLHLEKYENGLDVMPCQTRVLMMLVLRWAHRNPVLIYLADLLSRSNRIYRAHIYPESFVFAITDTMGIVIAGWVATRIYEAASERRLLTKYIYPLVLVFCAASYVLVALHAVRFYYDLPSLGFFAVGLYLIYFRKHPLLFAALFIVATINRETTLLLLLFFVLAAVTEGRIVDWKRSYAPRTISVVVPLAICWTGWHIFVNRLYAQNHFAWIPASKINFVLLIWPPAWPQLLAAGCYSILPVLLYRGYIKDPTLRIWLWTLPAWFGLMFFYAIIVEPRLYGELIPYLACVAALLAEQSILARFQRPAALNKTFPIRHESRHAFSDRGSFTRTSSCKSVENEVAR